MEAAGRRFIERQSACWKSRFEPIHLTDIPIESTCAVHSIKDQNNPSIWSVSILSTKPKFALSMKFKMAAKQKVMLMGVVGDAALPIYDGLIESGNFVS